MATTRTPRATPSNAGLLALEAALAGTRMQQSVQPLADVPSPEASDLSAVPDGIAIEFIQGITVEDEAKARRRIEAFLGVDWTLVEESFEHVDHPYRGLTALPLPGKVSMVGEAWALARTLAAVEGVQSATPLFAQIAPSPVRREAPGFAASLEGEGPAEPELRRTWHHQALRVPEAWKLIRKQGQEPGEGVVVAVLDTGYTDHPEILPNLTKATTDSNQVRGVDLLDEDDPRDPLEGRPPLVFPGHGTSVASVIASPEGPPTDSPDAPDWVSGIAPSAEVLPVRVTTNVVLLLPNKITPAIRRAVDAGADVINISLGLPYYWPALHASIRYAVSKGVIVVAASGNYWPSVVYPARFPEVLATANCDWRLHQWRWASAGEAVDVLVPGVAIQRAGFQRNDRDDELLPVVSTGTGTTFAAACSSGMAALWLTRHGGRGKLVEKYGGQAWRVPQAFHYLIRTTAMTLHEVPVGRYGVGLPQADSLLRAKLPTIEQLDRDVRSMELHLEASSGAGGGQPGLAVDEGDVNTAVSIRQLLGGEFGGPAPEELFSEVNFHIVSRPELRDALLGGRADTVRNVLRVSKHLSNALRRWLEAAEAARATLEVPEAGEAIPTFRPRLVPDPAKRSLKVYAFDPSFSGSLRAADYNIVTMNLPWEKLDPGPVGEYLEVVDLDPPSDRAYEPVNLDDPRLLPGDGLSPDESDPWFHQQMVYAVAMKTIRHFESALGRPAMWAVGREREGKDREPFYQRLRIYPHAIRERNAYYSPEKRALLFGYFRSPGPGGARTGPMVFTCLSYDIIAHETTHALLDGMYHRYSEDTNPDMLAFHEAFADIVALFQHFTHSEVLRAAIAETRGNLEADSLLGKLAQQFGEATGRRGALRDAIGQTDREGSWKRRQPDAGLLDTPEYKASPHLRGSILVAAVFDAFLKIYQRRVRLIIRVATGGSGMLPPGNIGADLAESLSREAAKTAGQVLHLCIRALDYLPPVDITFGEYLRAAITADRELVPDDPLGYRVAFVEAFRAWGIQAEGVNTVAPESLCWDYPTGAAGQFTLSESLVDQLNRLLPAWKVNRSRRELHEGTVAAKIRFNWELREAASRALGEEIGIDFARKFEVHTLRPANTVGPDGTINPMVVVTILQRKEAEDKPMIRTGATLLFNRGNGKIRYVIHKRDRRGTRADEFTRHQRFRLSVVSESDPYMVSIHAGEPFAALHLTGHL